LEDENERVRVLGRKRFKFKEEDLGTFRK